MADYISHVAITGRVWPGRGFWARLRMARSVARQRRQLSALDDHLLSDIGVARDIARGEARRPIWDVPAHWRE